MVAAKTVGDVGHVVGLLRHQTQRAQTLQPPICWRLRKEKNKKRDELYYS